MSNRNMKSALITAVVGLAFATPALAATDTATFNVTATVNDSCTVTATDLEFGVYDPNAVDLDVTSTITATCTEGASYAIGLDTGGNGASASSTTRAMDDGSGVYLEYELYSDASRNNIWDETTTVDNPSATGGDNPETVYGQIPAGQYVAAADYSDTINVTINY